MIMATKAVVSSGHYLASQAGMAMFQMGGNAMDAAAAAGFALHVLMPQQNGLAGEAPMLVHSARQGKTWALSGNGTAPRGATIEAFRSLGIGLIPGDGLLPAIVPPAVGSWILLLREFGRLRLWQVLGPAIGLSADGFAMYDSLAAQLAGLAERFRRDWPSSFEAYLPDSRLPEIGDLWRQKDLAGTLRSLSKADRSFRRRPDGLRAAHDAFYQGAIARRIDRFCRAAAPDGTGRSHRGFLTAEDMAAFEPRLEDPAARSYKGYRLFKCGPWTQGPALLQALGLLEGFDLQAMGHNSADYVHTVVECIKLAYADREFHYGDPGFVRVPLGRLLSPEYCRNRRRLVDSRKASLELRPGGHRKMTATDIMDLNVRFGRAARPAQGDTTAVQTADSDGNIVSAVPSGGWMMSSPVVGGLGFPLGTRGQMFSLAEGHPNSLRPGKRPRTTLTPTLAARLRRPPHLAFASPGGDCQDQWNLQFFLNVVEFGMSLQQAVEAPTFNSKHFPDSFYPRAAKPGVLHVEGRLPKRVRDELAQRGHDVRLQGPWSGGNCMAVSIDHRTGLLSAAASPRYDPAYAAGC